MSNGGGEQYSQSSVQTVTDECNCADKPVIKGIKKECDMIIPANENICKDQHVCVRMDFSFYIAKLNLKQFHAHHNMEKLLATVLT